MLSLGKNGPGQMPKPKGPGPAGLSRAQVQTDGEDLSGGRRDEEAKVGPWTYVTSCSDSFSQWVTLYNFLTLLIFSFF